LKLLTLKFSKESEQTPSHERPKPAQRTLFLSFEINNCFPTTALWLMKKSGKLAIHLLNSNVAIYSLPTLQMSLGTVALFEKDL
jgi:hypothetical protein